MLILIQRCRTVPNKYFNSLFSVRMSLEMKNEELWSICQSSNYSLSTYSSKYFYIWKKIFSIEFWNWFSVIPWFSSRSKRASQFSNISQIREPNSSDFESIEKVDNCLKSFLRMFEASIPFRYIWRNASLNRTGSIVSALYSLIKKKYSSFRL